MSLIHYSRLMVRTLLFCLLVLCSLDRSMAAEDIARAKILFQQGDYKGAVTLYESLLQKQGPHSGLYYDLGTSYYELGDLGYAMPCWPTSVACTSILVMRPPDTIGISPYARR